MPCAVAGQDHDEGEGTERDGMCLNMGNPWENGGLPSGKHTKSYEKSPSLIGKSTN